MPNLKSNPQSVQLAPVAAPFGRSSQASFAFTARGNDRFAYKGRPAARPAAPPKAPAPPPPKQPPAPDQGAPKPPEPAKEVGPGK
jgi:hypothetical protein